MTIRFNIHTVWLMMLVLTVSTYAMGKLDLGGPAIVLTLLLTAAIKSIFIIRELKGLRGVSFLWHAIMYSWLFTVIIEIAAAYVLSLPIT